MNRINKAFSKNKTVFIPYITVGDFSLKLTKDIVVIQGSINAARMDIHAWMGRSTKIGIINHIFRRTVIYGNC